VKTFNWFSSFSDGKDTVVELGTAGGASDDTRLVLLEDRLVSLDGNGNWSLHEGSLKLRRVVWGDISVRISSDDTLRFVIFAAEESTRLSNIWVVSLSLEWVRFGISESSVHHTTVATEVQPGAVNELLLREGNKISSLDLMSTLHGSSSGESPA
jgi:hypothetical protein